MGRKWLNIKEGKAKLDAARGATWSRCSKDIMKAAKEGGPNPESNFQLRIAIERARKANMPNDNIQRAILRGSGQLEGERLEEIVYEGYGPGGVALYMNIVTDNRNRTAADVRHILSKHGGNLGETGCVAWMFSKQGAVAVAEGAASEEQLMEIALEAGADDVILEEGSYTITCEPEALDGVLKALEAAQIPVERGEVDMVPSTTVEVRGEELQKLLKMMELLEEHDDVQNVYANFEIPDDEEVSLA